MNTPILQPGQFEAPAGEIPYLRLPARESCFKDRAARLRQLASGHTLGDFLGFMATIADAQHDVLQHFGTVALPDPAQLDLSKQHGMPPLAAQTWTLDPVWREALIAITRAALPHAPAPAQAAIGRVQEMTPAALEKIAHAILDGHYGEAALGCAPFVAAALQTYWTHMAITLGASALGRVEPTNLCPVCGSPPSISVVRIGPDHGLRYLHCSLCGSEWHMVRAKCSNCESSKGLHYYGIEGDRGAVKAEACGECGSYLKILYLDKDPQLDPVADDLATLALDILMDERGVPRSGPNLLFFPA